MAESSKSRKKKAALSNDPSAFVRNLHKLENETRVILYMPDDFRTLYEKPLHDRLKKSGIQAVVAGPEKLPDELGSYDRILAYQCPLPALVDEGERSDSEKEGGDADRLYLFDVKGCPSDELMTPFPRKPGFLTDLEYRYIQIQEIITRQEQNDHFKGMARMQQSMRERLLSVQERQVEVDELFERIQHLDKGYYLTLAYYLQQAIDRVLQLVTLGDVMKKYVKVLIVDDLGERTLEQMEELGFRRRFMSTMSQAAFNEAFQEFKELYQEQFPDTSVTQEDFFKKCTVFDDYEIVAVNQWNMSKGTLNVVFRLKKNPELSKKDACKLKEDPKKAAEKVGKLNREYQKLDDQLKDLDLEIKSSEIKGGLSENAYVGLNKKRKRILKAMKGIRDELEEVQREVNVRPELTIFSKDLLAAVRDKNTIQEILKQEYEDARDPEVMKPEKLKQLTELIVKKKKVSGVVRKLNEQVRVMHEKLASYWSRHPLDPDMSCQQLLGVHTLNKLEASVMGCGIARVNQLLNVYTGPYFHQESNGSDIDWNGSPVSRLSIHIASKHIKIETSLLQKFFHIKSNDMTGRLENTPALPRTTDYNDRRYGLFIMNFNSYPISEIISSLMMRNQSKRPYVPVLLIDPLDKIPASPDKTKLELLIGLKRDGEETISFLTPTYTVASLDDSDQLNSVLCEIMGIDITTVSSNMEFEDPDSPFSSAGLMDDGPTMDFPEKNGEFDLSQETGEQTLPSEEADGQEGAEAPQSNAAPEPVISRRKDDRIKLYIKSEKKEEIYTLGALFSFDDVATTTEQQKPAVDDPGTPGENDGDAATEEVKDQEIGEEESFQKKLEKPLPPVKQAMNPKNPFQF